MKVVGARSWRRGRSSVLLHGVGARICALCSDFHRASNGVLGEPSRTSKVISMPSGSCGLVISPAKESTLNGEFGRGIAQGLI